MYGQAPTRWSARVDPAWSFEAWRAAARPGLLAGITPADIDWLEGEQSSLLDAPALSGATPVAAPAPTVPRSFAELAATVLCHRDPHRLPLLYRLLWRIGHGERDVLSNPTDADVVQAQAWAQAVRRDAHKMKAFVRFREVPGEADAFIAWFEPEHHIVDRTAPFFARRFAGMRWAILTPTRSVRWDGQALAFGGGATRAEAPSEDSREDLWRTYYASIFNPARLNTRMMQQEMPAKYWKHLPEARLLPSLVTTAADRVEAMHAREARAPQRRIPSAPTPGRDTGTSARREAGSEQSTHDAAVTGAARGPEALAHLRDAAMACRRCPLWEPATRTVFGEGPTDASILFIGEQPGDKEDLSGRPFVGPAGQLLDQAMAEAGIARDRVYMTNAVKHFRYQRRGKQRIHQRPDTSHVEACRSWLAAEIEQVRPQIIVCLGATAAAALLGSAFRFSEGRGRWHDLHDGTRALVTVHPSWVLRQGEGPARHTAYQTLLTDLRHLPHAANPPKGDGGG